MGNVFSINISAKKGTAKFPVKEAIFKKDSGIEGDAHAGRDKNRQVSLLSWESIQKKNFCLKKEDKKLKPGDFAENITTSGIDLSLIKIGDRFNIGNVVLEVSQIGKKCHLYCEIYKKIGSCIMPGEGIFARVVKGGKAKTGDLIKVEPKIDAGILTVSDSCYRGSRIDYSGRYLVEACAKNNWNVLRYEVVPDEKQLIKDRLLMFSSELDLVLTTGGTGPGVRDITPEATTEVLEKNIPGIPELIRMKTFESTKFSVLSRAVAGIRGNTLIINIPGGLKGVKECFEILKDIILHAIKMIRGFPHED
ncbi:MAG: molybdopterin-binding protein [Candidatus Omnitrophica bacterium]|nr:molybdopterin-binding protein [Candidatus Omnitrophota bacterium]MCM8829217.1 molybdopterin-binding protein [Candidatus Omnitrophota bacterium]